MSGVATWDQMRLSVRDGLYANDLPSNRALPNDVTLESLQDGWTAQQPYVHARCVVTLGCALCGQALDSNDWTTHPCMVQQILGDQLWAPTEGK